MNKTPKSNTKKIIPPKMGSLTEENSKKHLYEEFFDHRFNETRCTNQASIEAMFDREYVWATTDESALIMSHFFIKEGVTERQFYKWVEKYPYCKEKHQSSLLAIGARRELGGLTKKFDTGFIRYSLPLYDKKFADLNVIYSKLKEDSFSSNGNKEYIVLEKCVDCTEVPIKKEENE